MKERPGKHSYMSLQEDMQHRPELYKFLKEVLDEAREIHKSLSYELIQELFWPSLPQLSCRQRNIVLDYLLEGLSERKSAQKYEIGRTTLQILKKRAKKRLKHFIFNHLEVELAILRMKKGKIKHL